MPPHMERSTCSVIARGTRRDACVFALALTVSPITIVVSHAGVHRQETGNCDITGTCAQRIAQVPTATTTTVAALGEPSQLGATTFFTAVVTGSAPTGSVSFGNNGVAISGCNAVVLKGSGNAVSARCSTNGLPLGLHAITADYSGDTANAPSSATRTHSVHAQGAWPAAPVYRFNAFSFYFYTASEDEKNHAVLNHHWTLDGIVYDVYIAPMADTSPVYRFHTGAGYFYTASETERNYVVTKFPRWKLEGIAFFAHPAPVPGTLPVYRFNTGSSFFYTQLENEKNYLLQYFPEWRLEGVAYYALP
jgi:hypothetical protein